jgi:endonuclease/exonuclease/phosphatase family metal-dependent hydrolase
MCQPAREQQARLLVEDARAYPDDYPQVLTGDMNCDASGRAISEFTGGGWIDTYEMVNGAEDPGHTFHEFEGPSHKPDMGRIDWIFVRGAVSARRAEIVRDSRDGRFPSDHYFVSADVSLA